MSHDEFTTLIKSLPRRVYDSLDGWGIKESVEYEGQTGNLYMVDGHDSEGKPWQRAAFVPKDSKNAIQIITLMVQQLKRRPRHE